MTRTRSRIVDSSMIHHPSVPHSGGGARRFFRFLTACLAPLFVSCAVYRADIQTIEADGASTSMDVTAIQGPWSKLEKGDLRTFSEVNEDGSYRTSAGGAGEGFDNASGANEALNIFGGLLTRALAAYLANPAAFQPSPAVSRLIPTPTPIPSASLPPDPAGDLPNPPAPEASP